MAGDADEHQIAMQQHLNAMVQEQVAQQVQHMNQAQAEQMRALMQEARQARAELERMTNENNHAAAVATRNAQAAAENARLAAERATAAVSAGGGHAGAVPAVTLPDTVLHPRAVAIPPGIKLAKPSFFTGTANHANVDSWLIEMANYIAATGVTDEDVKLTLAAQYLKDAAQQWYNYEAGQGRLGPGVSNFIHFATALKAQFQPLAAEHRARLLLRQLRLGSRTVTQYCSEFFRIVQQIPNMPEADRLFAFTSGLGDGDIGKDVEVRDPRTVQAAMQFAQLAEMRRNNHRRAQGGYTSSHSRPAFYHRSNGGAHHASNSGGASSSAGSSTSSPMELGSLNASSGRQQGSGQRLYAVEDSSAQQATDEGPHEAASTDEYDSPTHDGVAADNSVNSDDETLLTIEEAEELDERLFALHNHGRNQPPRGRGGQYVSREEVQRCRAQGLCFRCKKPGHIAAACPTHRGQQQSSSSSQQQRSGGQQHTPRRGGAGASRQQLNW